MTAILQSTLIDHSRWVEAVAFSPNGEQVASGSWDKTVKVWDATTGPVAFSADGTQVALGSEHETIKLWDVAKYLKASRLLGNPFSRHVKFRTCQSIKTSEPVRNSPRLG